ncbi:unnamed protein product [Vicia faba]|uniref:glucose-1-phosphate adenylyltransferase n=1 Tax=Vicia faba TaxID=3906 RepID=A0AAV0Z6A7_VICFA|nr:unnamed protein product [Vicia faba]
MVFSKNVIKFNDGGKLSDKQLISHDGIYVINDTDEDNDSSEQDPSIEVPTEQLISDEEVPTSDITDSVIGEGCVIKNCKIHHSVVGLRSCISEGAIIEDTLLMGADYYETDADRRFLAAKGGVPIGIGKNSHIRRAIIDKNARIGDDVKIINSDNVQEAARETEGYFIKSGIVTGEASGAAAVANDDYTGTDNGDGLDIVLNDDVHGEGLDNNNKECFEQSKVGSDFVTALGVNYLLFQSILVPYGNESAPWSSDFSDFNSMMKNVNIPIIEDEGLHINSKSSLVFDGVSKIG